MSDFVLVRQDNGLIGPVSRTFAERKGLDVVEGDATDAIGRLVQPSRENGRPAKPRTTVAQAAAKKASGDRSSEQQAVTPTEGAADNTLTNTKE